MVGDMSGSQSQGRRWAMQKLYDTKTGGKGTTLMLSMLKTTEWEVVSKKGEKFAAGKVCRGVWTGFSH